MELIKIATILMIMICVNRARHTGHRSKIEKEDDKSYATEDAFDLDIQHLGLLNRPNYGVTYTPQALQTIDDPQSFHLIYRIPVAQIDVDRIPGHLVDMETIECSNLTLYQDCEVLVGTIQRMEGLYDQQMKDIKQTHRNIRILTKRHEQSSHRKKRQVRQKRAVWTRIIGAVG